MENLIANVIARADALSARGNPPLNGILFYRAGLSRLTGDCHARCGTLARNDMWAEGA